MANEMIEDWVKTVAKNENLVDYTFEFDGNANKNDGYLGNISFITINGKTKEGEEIILNLAVKASKESPLLRQQSPIQQAFKREIYIYEDVFQNFNKLQKEMGDGNFLSFLTRSFGSYTSETREFLILDNLKKQGFELWDRKKCMTLEHVKLVLQAYGRWHAFSFALRKKKKDVFDKLVDGYTNMFMDFFMKVGLANIAVKLFEQSRDAVISEDEKHILEKLQYSKNNSNKVFHDYFYEDPDERVILHGDCWNNNFMFQFKDDITKPISVRVLDWQFSGYSSPAMDISHFLYGCCDTGKYKDMTELLKVYYESFGNCLTYLGCNPKETFSYERLVYHWKKYSAYGLLLNAFLVKFSIIDPDAVPDLAEAAEDGANFEENFDFDDFPNKEEYHRRVRDNLLHYVENLG